MPVGKPCICPQISEAEDSKISLPALIGLSMDKIPGKSSENL